MKLFLILIIVLTGCTNRSNTKTSSPDVFKKEGAIIFSPSLNVSYFFPFKYEQPSTNRELKNFLNYEYDIGFTIIWGQAKWRNNILDNYTISIPDNTFKAVAFASVEYSSLETFATDSVNYFSILYAGNHKTFYIYNDSRHLKGAIGIK